VTFKLETQSVDIIGSERAGTRDEIQIKDYMILRQAETCPVTPFPGLCIGGLTVKRVLVNQGGPRDGIDVEYDPIDEDHARMLESHGWIREIAWMD